MKDGNHIVRVHNSAGLQQRKETLLGKARETISARCSYVLQAASLALSAHETKDTKLALPNATEN